MLQTPKFLGALWALLQKTVRDSPRDSKVLVGLHEQAHPPAYRTTNWRTCNLALKQRGSLQIWFDPETIWLAVPSGKRGRPATFTE